MTDFIRLVEEMREWQRYYFRTRSKPALERCRRLEAAVDKFICEERTKELTFAPGPLPGKGDERI